MALPERSYQEEIIQPFFQDKGLTIPNHTDNYLLKNREPRVSEIAKAAYLATLEFTDFGQLKPINVDHPSASKIWQIGDIVTIQTPFRDSEGKIIFSAAVVTSKPAVEGTGGEWEFIALTQPYTDRVLDNSTGRNGAYFTDPAMNPARWNRHDANVGNKVLAVQDALYQALGVYITKPLHCGGVTLAENSTREDHQANVLGAFNAESYGSYRVLGITQQVSLGRIAHDVHSRTERTLELHNIANDNEARMSIGESGRSAVGVPWSVIRHSPQTPIAIVLDPLFLSDKGPLTVQKAPEGQTIADAALAQLMLNNGGLVIPESGRTDSVSPFDALKFFYDALTDGQSCIRRITPANGAKR